MGQAAARARAERINFHIIGTYAARRALIGVGKGERVPAGAAHSAMELVHLTEVQPQHGGSGKPRVVDVTRPGFRTARRRLPAMLARLDERDARRVAAENYALASEKVGSMAGASAEGSKTDGGAATNDGGVTTRIEYAGTIRAVERALASAGAALSPSPRGGGARREITARALLDAICLEGRDLKAILISAGWSGQRRDVATLSRIAEDCLEDMARALGLVALEADRPATSGAT
jgi:hypothetical protein